MTCAFILCNSVSIFSAAILGPGYSSEAIQISRLLSSMPDHLRLLQISPSTTASSLSDHELYSNFFRTIPSDDIQVKVRVEYGMIMLSKYGQVLHTPGPEMYPGMCTYCFTLKKAHLIICHVFIRASNFGTRSMKYEAK